MFPMYGLKFKNSRITTITKIITAFKQMPSKLKYYLGCPLLRLIQILVFYRQQMKYPLLQHTNSKMPLETKRNSSPSLDNISYSILKLLPYKAKEFLVKFYNDCLEGGISLPDDWKKYNILSILEQNKDPLIAENYRPTILSSCPLKVLEIMIKNRLDWFIEHNLLLGNLQSGFRKGRGTVDNLACLHTNIL